MTDPITRPTAGMNFQYHDAAKVQTRLANLGLTASLIEAEGVRTFHTPDAVIVALNEADVQPRSLQFLSRVLAMVKRDHACRLISGMPLPELPRPRFSRRRRAQRPEHAAARPAAPTQQAIR
ncbi:hypothetical protein [Rudaea sp.]|uniref:hypothetical protein n=1 Tax=Rudaea sp. TaxID=2136325 RepID=UPI0037853082